MGAVHGDPFSGMLPQDELSGRGALPVEGTLRLSGDSGNARVNAAGNGDRTGRRWESHRTPKPIPAVRGNQGSAHRRRWHRPAVTKVTASETSATVACEYGIFIPDYGMDDRM